MAFFDNIKSCLEQTLKKSGEVAEIAVRKGGEVAEKAVKKSGELAEIAKLNLNLKTEEGKLVKLYTKLGMLTYEKADAAECAAVIVEIDDTKENIEQIKADIIEKNGKQICPGCGKELDIDVAFCQYCGAKLERPEPEVAKTEEAPATAKVEIKDEDSDSFIKTFDDVVKKYDL